jgi:SAM-dependent methyltransferase
VSRGLWDYLHDAAIARDYDDKILSTPLAVADVRFAEEQFPRPGRLIDLGCGTGRLLIPFARHGFWVLGVDLSEPMLRVAGERAKAENVDIRLLKANLVELESIADQSFDYAACLFSTLGMIVGSAARQRFLRQVFRILRPGGKFVLHVHNRWFNFWDPQGRAWLWRDFLRGLLGQAHGTRKMPTHQGIGGFDLHLYTRREVARLLRDCGFRLLAVRALGLDGDGRLKAPRWFGWLRAYGYLIATAKTPSVSHANTHAQAST